MGNCLFGGMGGGGGEAAETTIQVLTANGGIMEFQGPVTVGFILEEFPCHAIFKSDDLFWKPLSNQEELHPGGVPYLLLPLHTSRDGAGAYDVKVGHVRSKSIPNCTTITTSAAAAAYRMSFDSRSSISSASHSNSNSNVLKRSNTDVFSRYSKGGAREGVWKVKLVISPEQLLEILSQETRTQELIESVRTVAKCGCSSGAVSTGFSDQWSAASSMASSNKD